MMNQIGGVKVSSVLLWLVALGVAFVAVLIGMLAISRSNSGAPSSAVQWYMMFIGGVLVISGLLVTVFEIVMGNPLQRVMRAATVFIAGLAVVSQNGMVVLALVAALAIEAYLLRHSIAAGQAAKSPTEPQQ